MRTTIILLFFSMLHTQATSSYSQKIKLDLKLKSTSIREACKQIERTSDYIFVFSDNSKDMIDKKINVTVNSQNVEEVLDNIFAKSELTYKVLEKQIVVFRKDITSEEKQNQQPTVAGRFKGKVVDTKGEALIGVSIKIKNTTQGVATDVSGNFDIALDESKGNELTLVFSYIGFKTQEKKVKRGEAAKIVLVENVSEIGEVVVTGMFKRKKEGFTGSAVSVSGDELLKLTQGNVLKVLELFDPGFKMNVSNFSGSDPNALPDFSMRGQSNIGDYSARESVILRGDLQTRPNQPLFVLDGVIGVDVQTIIDMDPNQIESVTLLKDAAAMVIYGSRASNGVVVIETRSPVTGKLRVSYNGNYQLQAPDLSVYNLLNAREKLEIEKRAGFYEDKYTADDTHKLLEQYRYRLLEVERGVDTYWLKEPVQTSFSHRHGLDLEGGDNVLRYKLSFGYNKNTGVMKGSDVNGKTGRIDIRYRNKKILISNILTVESTIADRVSPYGSFGSYATINPYFRNRNEDGVINKYLINQPQNGASDVRLNPTYDTQFNQTNRSTTFNVRDALIVEYTPVENIRLTLDANYTQNVGEVDIFKPGMLSEFRSRPINEQGSYRWSFNKRTRYNVAFSGSYNKVYRNTHFLSAFARYDIAEDKSNVKQFSKTGFPNESLDEIFLGSRNLEPSGSEATSRSIGFVGTVNYSYDQRYSTDVSLRVDASSQFGRNNRFAPFWSAGLRWNAFNEKWIKQLNFFEDLTLRASYGVTGSQGFAPYQSLQVYTSSGLIKIYDSSDVVGSILESVGNPHLKWQQTDQANIGVDFNFWKRIISGRIEVYHKYTRNTLLPLSLPPSVGFESIPDNLGNISNVGYEVMLRFMFYNNIQKGINLSLTASASQNRNKIENISNALKIQNDRAKDETKNTPLPRYEPGYSQSMIWGVRSLGIDPSTGQEIFLKKDGITRTYEWSGNDMIPLGEAEPSMRGSLGAYFNWGGWNLSIGALYKMGGLAFNQTLIDKVENADLRNNVDKRAYTDRWREPGDITLFKRYSTADLATKASSRFLMKDNELYINSINLSYWINDSENKYLKKLGLTNASFGIYLQDIARFSTIKIERGINYPFARSISFSVNLIF